MGAISDMLIGFAEKIYPNDSNKQIQLEQDMMNPCSQSAPFTIFDCTTQSQWTGASWTKGPDYKKYDSPYEAANDMFCTDVEGGLGLEVRNASGETWHPYTIESFRQKHESGYAPICIAEIQQLLLVTGTPAVQMPKIGNTQFEVGTLIEVVSLSDNEPYEGEEGMIGLQGKLTHPLAKYPKTVLGIYVEKWGACAPGVNFTSSCVGLCKGDKFKNLQTGEIFTA